MTTMLVDCHRNAPARPPGWRWRLAEAIVSGQLPPSKRRLDPWIARAIRFLSDQAVGKGEAPYPGPARSDPALLGAFHVLSSGDSRLRSELEARVLAGQTPGAISALCGLTESVVEAYESLHFNVRDRLGAADFITAIVIGIAPQAGLADIDSLMKVYAYGYGPLVLDAVIAVLNSGRLADGEATSAKTADETLIAMAVRARSLAVNAKNAPGLIQLQLRLREIEQRAAADSFTNVPIRTTVEPWTTAASGVRARRPDRAFPVDLGPAILTESIREVPDYRPGAITVVFPATGRSESPTPARRTA